MKRILMIALAIFCMAPASAQDEDLDWWWIGEFGTPPARLQMYVDHSRMKVGRGRTIQALVFYIYEKPLANGQVSELMEFLVDCDKRTLTTIARRAYDNQGKETGFAKIDAAPREKIKSSTNGDVLRRHVCRDKPLPAIGVRNPMQHAMRMLGRVPSETAASAKKEEPETSYGTGFFVGGGGNVVTSYHVVDEANDIIVYTEDGKPHPATIVKASAATDLVVLRIDYKPAHFLSLASANSAKPGDRVFTFGFPVLELLGFEPKYTDGAISSLSGLGGEAVFAQMSVPVQPGNSGGPVVNEQGAVVGVVAAVAAVEAFAKVTGGALPQNVNWAVRSEYIAPLIGNQAVARPLSRDEAIALARQSVVIILAEK